MMVFDLSLVDEANIIRELRPDGLVLVNTNRGIESLRELKRFRIGLIDAGSIARRAGLGDASNTAMLGAYVRLTHLVRMDTLIDVVRTMVPAKVEENVRAVQEAYEETRIFEREG